MRCVLEPHEIEAWPTTCREVQLGSLITADGHTLSTRFARLTARAGEPTEPGLQVCDFVLWAVQRAKPQGLELKGERLWLDRLGVRGRSGGGVVNGPLQHYDGDLGRGARRRCRFTAEVPVPRMPDTLAPDQAFALFAELVSDVRSAAAAAEGSPRIEHLARELSACVPPIRLGGPGEAMPVAQLNAVAEAFILVCDTLPIYDRTDPLQCSRTTEKRSLAAYFLSGRAQLPLLFGAVL